MAIIDRRGKPLPDNHPFKGTRIIFGGPQLNESDKESAASLGALKGSEDVQSKTTGRKIRMAKGTNLGWAKPDDPIYSSGPMISFRPQLTESTSDTQTNTDVDRQPVNCVKTIGAMVTQITEEELQRRLAVLRSKERIAGPDDPIYSSGLTMTPVKKLPRSTSNSTENVDEVRQTGSSATLQQPGQPQTTSSSDLASKDPKKRAR